MLLSNSKLNRREVFVAQELTRGEFLAVVNIGRWMVGRIHHSVRTNGFVQGVTVKQVRVNEDNEIRFDQQSSGFGLADDTVVRIEQDGTLVRLFGVVMLKQKLSKKDRRKAESDYCEVPREVVLVDMIRTREE
ncbi:TPA: hypothetical protein DF272_00410 [Candidatus Falkowbacteria bacterium]|nr:hypothetical protein [Candidatus Falkowbacteria bacterium]